MNLFQRYIWLIDIVYHAKRITFREINRRWLCSSLNDTSEELPLKTFHNHKRSIQEIFDINICCDRRGDYSYYIENSEDLAQDSVRSWLLNTFAVNNLIDESRHLRQRILFEEIPSGQKFLASIVEAMRDGQIVEITYQSFWKDIPHTIEIEPFCAKIFKQRWYVVARAAESARIRIYALDRIIDLHTTEKSFDFPSDFDPKNYFEDSFGIIVDEDYEIEQVKIRVMNNQQKYFRSLPLHRSQAEIEIKDNYSIFEYRLRATVDFQQELLSHGSDVEVLAPKWLREWFGSEILKMKKLYIK